MVDARNKVGIEGVSRYGKAALVTEAFEPPRIAVGLIASSGEGGAKLFRHIFGEGDRKSRRRRVLLDGRKFLSNTAPSDPPMTPADLPVDSHELIALCAPRPLVSSATARRSMAIRNGWMLTAAFTAGRGVGQSRLRIAWQTWPGHHRKLSHRTHASHRTSHRRRTRLAAAQWRGTM